MHEIRLHVYFVQCQKTGLIKIGQTTNVLRRFRELQRENPDSQLTVLNTIPSKLFLMNDEMTSVDDPEGWRAACSREGEIHHRFESSRSHGEWFRPILELMKFIEEQPFSSDLQTLLISPRRPRGGTKVPVTIPANMGAVTRAQWAWILKQ